MEEVVPKVLILGHSYVRRLLFCLLVNWGDYLQFPKRCECPLAGSPVD